MLAIRELFTDSESLLVLVPRAVLHPVASGLRGRLPLPGETTLPLRSTASYGGLLALPERELVAVWVDLKDPAAFVLEGTVATRERERETVHHILYL